MCTKIKKFLKKILPPPVNSFMREVNGIRSAISQQNTIISQNQQATIKELNEVKRRNITQNSISDQQVIIKELSDVIKNENLLQKDRYLDLSISQREIALYVEQLGELLCEQQEKNNALMIKLEEIEKKIAVAEEIEKKIKAEEIISLEKRIIKDLAENTAVSREVLWAQIYNNYVSTSSWLKENDFAPGRWAVGYPLLFVLYSTLIKITPQKILEIGLGQSTHMITQYAEANSNVDHLVIEQDKLWVEFFCKTSKIASNTSIKMLDYLENGSYKEDNQIRVYDKFKETIGLDKFDLIVIDAPTYNGNSKYNRVDVLSVLPKCLSDKFVIILDDCNRLGEANTAKEITAILRQNEIKFFEKEYKGEKIFHIWCSEDVNFLCSL